MHGVCRSGPCGVSGVENSCSHTCVDQKLDKTPGAYVFMFMCRDGAPCFKHELDLVGLDITPSVILNKSGLDVECGAYFERQKINEI